MPVYQALVNFDEAIQRLSKTPIIINTLNDFTEEDKKSIRNYTQTILKDDYISSIPSCDCGELKGEFNVGIECKTCHTMVHSTIDEALEPILWFKAPEGIPGLINPKVWGLLNSRFRKSGIPILKWFIDSHYKMDKNIPFFDMLEAQLRELGVERGYINFCNNFDTVIEFLFSLKEFSIKKQKKKDNRDYLYDLIHRERNLIFSQYWPIMNKALIIVEETNTGIYLEPLIKEVLNITYMLINIDKHPNLRIRENRIVKALEKIDNFYDAFNKKIVLKKAGMLRKHIFATRSHFSARGVISSNTGIHDYDELWAPWGVGVTAFREHLLNKLFKLGWNLIDSINFLYSHVNKYNPLLDQLLKELVAESPYNGIPVIFQRNPSLQVGSAQVFRITRFKDNVEDNTFTYSIMCVSAPNADLITV